MKMSMTHNYVKYRYMYRDNVSYIELKGKCYFKRNDVSVARMLPLSVTYWRIFIFNLFNGEKKQVCHFLLSAVGCPP